MNKEPTLAEQIAEWNRREAEEIARIEAQYRNDEFLQYHLAPDEERDAYINDNNPLGSSDERLS